MNPVHDEQTARPPSRPLPAYLDPRAGRRRRTSSPAASSPTPSSPKPPSFGRALTLTVVGAVLPGTAFLAAGYRRTGWTLLAGFLALVGVGAWLVTGGQHLAIRFAVNPTGLTVAIAAAVALAVVWALVVIAGYRVLAPDTTARGQHLLGGLLVTLLALAVAAPAFEAAHLAAVQRNLITGLFADGGESATVPAGAEANPWGSRDRVNVLLLGGDGGDGRDGVRTDSVVVASIDTTTGVTTTFSLPRNLEELPFPKGSPLAAVYPDGFDAGSESESLLNAVYRNGPAAHPGILGPTANAGADFLKLGVGEALGLTIDYYVLINLDGFSQLIDALGGITVNVNYYVPIGGEPTIGILPDAYIAPGPDQLMDGERALHYARGRFGLTDYQRMDRQRCMIDAIVSAVDPLTLLARYQQIAATTQDIVSTDIPQSVVGDFVDLALKVKDAGIQSVVFDDTVIRPAYPDYAKIRTVVRDALVTASWPAPAAVPAAGGAPGAGVVAAPAAAPAGAPAVNPSTSGTTSSPVIATSDACAYDAVAAQEALDEGQPPTRRSR